MGSCLSKKKDSSSSSVVAAAVPVESSAVTVDPKKLDDDSTQNVLLLSKQEPKRKDDEAKQEDGLEKKEIFVIKHRKSHDKRSVTPQQNEEAAAGAAVNVVEVEKGEIGNGNSIPNGVVRTSSCTKEEVDAILIQCGRLSRSNSSGKTASSARKYSGSKRSYDFDHDNERERDGGDDNSSGGVKKKSSDDDQDQIHRQHRPRHRQSSRQSPASSSHGRRRTPSREREQQQSQQRSGSRDRGSGGGGSGSGSGRRVSRSPGRRSENNQVNVTNANANSNRPGKMVSVPASVTSMVMDKSNNINGHVETATTTNVTAIRRTSVKRNADEAVGSRTAGSPRSQSPARANASNGKNSNENQQQQPCLSRNSSRKAEHSPYRRNPLSEIDPNSLAFPQSTCNNKTSSANNNRGYNKSREAEVEGVIYQAQIQKPKAEIFAQGTNSKDSSRGTLNNKVGGANIIEREHQQQILEEAKTQLPMTGNAMVTSVAESQKPQSLTRSRSSRRSRDLDFNPETLLNPTPSYTALLLEDIQNFHQKSTPSVSLPACVSKAHSILEAVADLNSTTSSNLSCAYSEVRKTPSVDQSNNKNAYNSAGINLVGKKMTEAKDPFVESEVFATDDLMEPSFHRYVTVGRGGCTLGGVDLDEQESSGSNSFVGGGSQQNTNFSSSSWEPNSADSTDRWTSRSNTKEEDQSPLGFQRNTDYQQGGNLRGRVPVVAAAAST